MKTASFWQKSTAVWQAAKQSGEPLGVMFFFVGVSILVVAAFLATGAPSVGIAVGGIGLAMISIALGFIALGIGAKSEEQTAALANLQFDEKAVAMENYLKEFGEGVTVSTSGGTYPPAGPPPEIQSEYKKFLWDLRAMSEVARWADSQKRAEAASRLGEIRKTLVGKIRDTDLGEVARLCSQIGPNASASPAVGTPPPSPPASGANATGQLPDSNDRLEFFDALSLASAYFLAGVFLWKVVPSFPILVLFGYVFTGFAFVIVAGILYPKLMRRVMRIHRWLFLALIYSTMADILIRALNSGDLVLIVLAGVFLLASIAALLVGIRVDWRERARRAGRRAATATMLRMGSFALAVFAFALVIRPVDKVGSPILYLALSVVLLSSASL